jgi:hypothetical protein
MRSRRVGAGGPGGAALRKRAKNRIYEKQIDISEVVHYDAAIVKTRSPAPRFRAVAGDRAPERARL